MSQKLKENSAIQTHINTLQSIISRMGNNSSNCKTWCMTLVAGIMVLLVDKSKQNFAWITVIPLVLFYLLDGFYLGLEKHFRDSYKEFLAALNQKHFDFARVYYIEPASAKLRLTGRGLASFATTPFYAILALMIILTTCWTHGG